MQRHDFNKIVYRKPIFNTGSRFLIDIYGLDSEAYTNGKPFLFCISDGLDFSVEDIPSIFFKRKYRNKNFVVWNIKYDAGSILSVLPNKVRRDLWLYERVEYHGYAYRYIPHKLLRISKNKNSISIWDIAQFYGGSLDYNARKFLGKGKLDMDVTKFTPNYVARHRRKIIEYCVNDAELVHQLCEFALASFQKINVYPTNLYSIANIGFSFFKMHSKIVDVYRFWQHHHKLLEYAYRSYNGGKFEITARGSFTGYEYDVTSAYPYEMINLLDLTDAAVIHSKSLITSADYGFLKVFIDIPEPVYHCTPYYNSVPNYYPIGMFATYITLQEYNYFRSVGVRIKILDGYWLKINNRSCPYIKPINMLFKAKETYRKTDPRLSEFAKKMMNSFYGKMIQLIPKSDGSVVASASWNIIYGAIISANTRIKVSKIQTELDKSCIGVHTDSVLTTKPIPKKYIGTGIGKFALKEKGDAIVIACGMYQIGSKQAYRGLMVGKDFTWSNFLRMIGKRSTHRLDQNKLISWIGALARENPKLANRMINEVKILDLNCDVKRLWLHKTTGIKLLNGLQYSIPHIRYESVPNAKNSL